MIKNIPRIIGFNNRSRFDLSINLSDCDSDLKSNKHQAYYILQVATVDLSWCKWISCYVDEDPIT